MGSCPACLTKVYNRFGSDEDPDSAWKKQNEAALKNDVYKLVDFRNGGKLIEVYKEHGKKGLIEFIKRELPQFLAGDGSGEIVDKLQYARFLNIDKEQDDLSEKELLDAFEIEIDQDDFLQFTDHELCWSLLKRGGVGETALHLCYLNNTPAHKEIAKCMLDLYPKLALDVYEGKEYYGESCLHIAIVNNDLRAVKHLVWKYNARLDQKCTGRFFLPEDQKNGRTIASSDYFGYAYYGEYPLCFAACFDNQEMYDYIIDMSLRRPQQGLVDPNAKDNFGNTILHLLVIHDKPSMYAHVLKHHKMPADPEILNNDKLTPLALACKLGRSNMFNVLIELGSIEFWFYGSVQCNAYPLQAVDSIGPGGETDWNSALMLIVDGNKDEHLTMLSTGVIYKLLEVKWNIFAKRYLFVHLIVALVYLLLLSVCVYTRPAGDLIGGTDTVSIVRYCCELLVCALVIFTYIFEIREIKLLGVSGFFSKISGVPAKAVHLFSCSLIIFCIPVRVAGLRYVEDILFITAVVTAWPHLLFFFRGLKSTGLGPFITMIYKMVINDLLRFGIIYCIFLYTFSPSLYYLYKGNNHDGKAFDTPYGTYMTLFHMTFGEYPHGEISESRIPILSIVVFAVYCIITPTLLMNMLIAMMSHTFQTIQENSKREWLKQWATIILVLERSLSKADLIYQQRKYADEISKKNILSREFGDSIMKNDAKLSNNGGSSDTGCGNQMKDDKCLGLILVKSRGTSKAQARRQAKANWKLIGRNARSQLIQQRQSGPSSTGAATSSSIYDVFTTLKAKKLFMRT